MTGNVPNTSVQVALPDIGPLVEKDVAVSVIALLPPPVPVQTTPPKLALPKPLTENVSAGMLTVAVAVAISQGKLALPPAKGKVKVLLQLKFTTSALPLALKIQVKLLASTVRLTERDVLLAFVALVKVTVSEWVPGLRRMALVLTATRTLVLAPAASKPLVFDRLIQLWVLETVKLMSWPPVLVRV